MQREGLVHLKIQDKCPTGQDVPRVKGNKRPYQGLRLASQATVIPAKGDLEPAPDVLDYAKGERFPFSGGPTNELQIDEVFSSFPKYSFDPNVTLLRRP